MFALNCRLKPLWKTSPSPPSRAKPSPTGPEAHPGLRRAGHKPMPAPFGCLRWKRQAGSVCFPLSSLQTLPLSRSEDRFGWQPPGIWGYNTNYDREASIRKTSVSLPVKLSCVAAWLEPSYLFLMLPLERRVRLVCLATKMILKLPSSWKSVGFFESALLEALGMKGVPYYRRPERVLHSVGRTLRRECQLSAPELSITWLAWVNSYLFLCSVLLSLSFLRCFPWFCCLVFWDRNFLFSQRWTQAGDPFACPDLGLKLQACTTSPMPTPE